MNFSLNTQVDIHRVVELKARFEDFLSKNNMLAIDASQVHRIDSPGLQLLLAVKIHCQNIKIDWKWCDVSCDLVSAAKVLGLIEPLGLDDFS